MHGAVTVCQVHARLQGRKEEGGSCALKPLVHSVETPTVASTGTMWSQRPEGHTFILTPAGTQWHLNSQMRRVLLCLRKELKLLFSHRLTIMLQNVGGRTGTSASLSTAAVLKIQFKTPHQLAGFPMAADLNSHFYPHILCSTMLKRMISLALPSSFLGRQPQTMKKNT